ncbi:pseudaminic acid biosynthesis-associated methylase [Formivibrio citricus]|uniref:Pseudaminic acid biosynthesis-associated methylase n=1 Tax=Formivibrio citricus TaxID=83765 RepID=A0A1I4XVK9_9NEIS|nr:pseudaminic acid biosynthesis-associated methylase [Formivibrio citricus]SFN29875.1 pseudaminic acid biosynthesis-associated methylase [Formivibrio citricus]
MHKTEQEVFWAGEFGNDYISRNEGCEIVAGNLALFSKVLERTGGVGSVIEFGANIGLNLRALKTLLPGAEFAGIEINAKAAEKLGELGFVDVHHGSILEFFPKKQFDFVFSKGVLIHIAPESLPDVYDKLYETSARYICLAEYYNQDPVEIPYRGHAGKMFKRDFAGEMLKRYSDISLVGYGFVYQHDPVFPLDDITWFLLEKK